MKSVDLHSHFLPEDTIKEFEGTIKGPSGSNEYRIEVMGKIMAQMPEGFFRVGPRIREMESLNIDHQVISPTHHLFMYSAESEKAHKIAISQNNGIARICREHPDRFTGNATLPMQDSNLAVREMERTHSELELSGIEIGTNIAGANLDSDKLYPVYERAQDLGMPIFVHPNDFLGPERLSRYYMGIVVGTIAETTIAVTSLLFGGVMKKFPKLDFIFCHGGGAVPYQIGRIKHALDVREEMKGEAPFTGSDLKHIYFDSVLFDGKSMELLVDTWGADNVVFGTDYPFNMGNWWSSKILPASPSGMREKILNSNFRRLYGKVLS